MNKLNTVVRTLILREATKASVRNSGQRTSTKLTELLISNETRNVVYRCCIEINTWDCERRYSIAVLLLSYLKSFPPTREVLLLLREQYLQFLVTSSESSVRTVYDKLLQLIETQSKFSPFIHFNQRGKVNLTISVGHLHNFCSTSWRPCSVNQRCKIQSFTPSTNSHLSMEILSTSESNMEVRYYKSKEQVANSNKGKDEPIVIPPLVKSTKKEVHFEENSFCHFVRNSKSNFIVKRQCYILTNFKPCTPSNLDKYILTVKQFRNDYSNNNKTIEATVHIVHVILPLYLSKIPFFAHSNSFRGISISFLPLLFEWMESEYLCIRNHVYDFLINFACHVQLIDRKSICQGLTAAVEKEVIWLLLQVLHYQWVVRKENDISTWRSVLRATLIVIPPCYYNLLDVQIILELLQLPEVVNDNTEIFYVLTKMLLSALTVDSSLTRITSLRYVLNESKLQSININLFIVLNNILRKASTVNSQKNLFALCLSLSLRELHRWNFAHQLLSTKQEKEYLWKEEERQEKEEELEHRNVRGTCSELITDTNMRCDDCVHESNGSDRFEAMPLKINKIGKKEVEGSEEVSLTPSKSDYITLNQCVDAIFDLHLFNEVQQMLTDTTSLNTGSRIAEKIFDQVNSPSFSLQQLSLIREIFEMFIFLSETSNTELINHITYYREYKLSNILRLIAKNKNNTTKLTKLLQEQLNVTSFLVYESSIAHSNFVCTWLYEIAYYLSKFTMHFFTEALLNVCDLYRSKEQGNAIILRTKQNSTWSHFNYEKIVEKVIHPLLALSEVKDWRVRSKMRMLCVDIFETLTQFCYMHPAHGSWLFHLFTQYFIEDFNELSDNNTVIALSSKLLELLTGSLTTGSIVEVNEKYKNTNTLSNKFCSTIEERIKNGKGEIFWTESRLISLQLIWNLYHLLHKNQSRTARFIRQFLVALLLKLHNNTEVELNDYHCVEKKVIHTEKRQPSSRLNDISRLKLMREWQSVELDADMCIANAFKNYINTEYTEEQQIAQKKYVSEEDVKNSSVRLQKKKK